MQWSGLVAGGLVLAVAGGAAAQPPGLPGRPGAPGVPAGRPTFSPYLNLLRQNNPAYLNYYGLVRPQLNLQQSIQGLQQGLAANQYQTQQLQSTEATLVGTGHPSFFMNQSRYFMTNGAGLGGNRGSVQPNFGARPGGIVAPMGAAGRTLGAAGLPTQGATPARR